MPATLPDEKDNQSSTSIISQKFYSLASNLLQSTTFPRTLSSISSAMLIIAFTHPLDTAKKRMQVTNERLIGKNITETTNNYIRVILRQSYTEGFTACVKDLYPGIWKALVYKGWQLPYRWVASNTIRDKVVNPYLGSNLNQQFGESWAKVLAGGIAGTLTGIGEAVFLIKWDSEKIAEQTKAKGVHYKLTLAEAYRPVWVTMCRNGIGSFLLFGTEALINAFVFNGKKRDELSFAQNTLGFIAGGIAGVIAPMPFDTVKTIMQKELSKRSATVIAYEMWQQGGIKPFYRALGLGAVLNGIRAGLGFGFALGFGPFFSKQCAKLDKKLKERADQAVSKPRF